MKAIINIKIYDYKNYIENGYIIFDKKIQKTGTMDEFNFEGEVIDGNGRLVLPGLINFHTHIYSMLIRGFNIGASPVTFQDILDQVWWKFDSYLTKPDLEASAYHYGVECLKSGVTSLIDHNASGEIPGSLSAIKNGLSNPLDIKSMLCFETSDRFDTENCIEENSHKHFGLHASLSLSDKTLKDVKDNLDNRPIHIHVAESIEDEEDSLRKYDKRVVNRLDKFNLLTKDSILAHCVHIDDEEANIIGKTGSVIVLNPTSNMNNAVGTFSYKRFRDNKIQLLVGTDGLGSNIAASWQNLLYVGKQSMKDPNGIGIDEIKNHILLSYEYFNRLSGYKLGQIKTGFNADFLLLDYDPPTPINSDNIFGHVFYGLFGNFTPHSVFIDGERKIDNYSVTFKKKDYSNVAEKLWKRIEESL
ncbi:MAG: amidohydrolase family protein [Clostridiales bacterium]|nr:amidohydrolase family protein [Clostridiales bacterium]